MLMVTARLGALDKAMGRKGMEREREKSFLVWMLSGRKGNPLSSHYIDTFRVRLVGELKLKSSPF